MCGCSVCALTVVSSFLIGRLVYMSSPAMFISLFSKTRTKFCQVRQEDSQMDSSWCLFVWLIKKQSHKRAPGNGFLTWGAEKQASKQEEIKQEKKKLMYMYKRDIVLELLIGWQTKQSNKGGYGLSHLNHCIFSPLYNSRYRKYTVWPRDGACHANHACAALTESRSCRQAFVFFHWKCP